MLISLKIRIGGHGLNKNVNNKNKKGFLKEKGYKPPSKPGIEKIEQYQKRDSRTPPKTRPSPGSKDTRLRRFYILRYSIVTFAILILILGLVISYNNFINISDGKLSIEEAGYELMKKLQDYAGLKFESEEGSGLWDNNKFLMLTSNDIEEDLVPDTEFIIEVEDLSSYPIKYNRTLENQLAWSSTELLDGIGEGKNKFSISTLVNIHVSSEEVHLARLTVTVWE